MIANDITTRLNKLENWEWARAHPDVAFNYARQVCEELERNDGADASHATTLARAKVHLGLYYLATSQYKIAKQCFEDSHILSERAGDELGSYYALQHLGKACSISEDFDAAIQHYARAAAFYERVHSPEL